MLTVIRSGVISTLMDQSVKPLALDALECRSIFQSRFWAEVKKQNSWNPLAFHFSMDGYCCDVLVLARKFSFFSIAYIPMGFTHGVSEKHLTAFASGVRKYLPSSCIILRFDLDWSCTDSIETKKLRKCRFSVQPLGTVRIDLSQDLSFKDRVKRNLKKEEGIVVRLWDGDEDVFSKWYDTYVHTALRDNFSTRSYDYIRSIFSLKGLDVEPRLYIAYSDGEISGGIVNLRGKNEEVYLFGSSIKHTGNISCGYVLQAEAIMRAKEDGVKVYDLFGIEGRGEENSHIASLTTFKTAFGGERTYRMPTLDYVYNPAGHVFRIVDSIRYKLARRSRI